MTELRNGWPQAVLRELAREPLVVRVMLATARGSVPREAGADMLVSRAGTAGSIGGGQLEWEAQAAARALFDAAHAPARLQRLVLAADLGQCCGGVVEIWLERYTRADVPLLEEAGAAAAAGAAVLVTTLERGAIDRHVVRVAGAGAGGDAAGGEDEDANRMLRTPRAHAVPRLRRTADDGITVLERLDDALPPLWLFGAGHVGRALVRILAELPLRLTWIDSRRDQFPVPCPDGVRILHDADPAAAVASAPPGSRFLVMTHSHPLDYTLCRAILMRSDFATAGLIGSVSKAARFRSRLRRDGVDAAAIARLVCPVGIGGIASKWPAAIAVGIAAQVLLDLRADTHADAPHVSEATCAGTACANCGSHAVAATPGWPAW